MESELAQANLYRLFTKQTSTYCHFGYVSKTPSQYALGDQCIVPCILYTDCDLNTSWPRYRRSTVRLAAKPSERIVPETAMLTSMQAFLTRCARCDVRR